MWEHAQVLPGGAAVLVGPSGPEQARALGPHWESVAATLADVGDADVLVDCGRVTAADGLVSPLLAAADLVVVLTRADVAGAAQVRADLTRVARAINDAGRPGGGVARLAVGVVDAPASVRRPAQARQVAEVLADVPGLEQVPVIGVLAWDWRGAAVLEGSRLAPRWRRPALARTAAAMAAAVQEAVGADQRPLAGHHPEDGRGADGEGGVMTAPVGTRELLLGLEAATVTRLVGLVRADVAARREERESEDQRFTAEDARRYGRSQLLGHVSADRLSRVQSGQPSLSTPEEQVLIDRVWDVIFGNGSLATLLSDPDVWEIDINGPDDVFVSSLTRGRYRLADSPFRSNEEIQDWVTHVGLHKQAVGTRVWDASTGIVEMQLHDPTDRNAHNARIVAIRGANADFQVAIRLLRNARTTLEDLVAWGDCTQVVARFLRACVLARTNLVLSGRTGTGKTTVARALIDVIPAHERLFVLEHFPELGGALSTQDHPDLVVWSERGANAEGRGALSLDRLVGVSRRFDPDRIMVGELMGEELVPFLRALTQGNCGGITTMHAQGLHEVPPRLLSYAAEAGMARDVAVPLLGLGLDVLVQLDREDQGPDRPPRRWISGIAEVTYGPAGDGGDRIRLNTVFEDDGDGVAVPKAPLSQALARRLDAVGWDRGSHQCGGESW